MKTVEICHRSTNAVLYSSEVDDADEYPVRTALQRANFAGANLAGANLAEYGAERAGAMIYRASTGRVPHFFASNERALEDLKASAADQMVTP